MSHRQEIRAEVERRRAEASGINAIDRWDNLLAFIDALDPDPEEEQYHRWVNDLSAIADDDESLDEVFDRVLSGDYDPDAVENEPYDNDRGRSEEGR